LGYVFCLWFMCFVYGLWFVCFVHVFVYVLLRYSRIYRYMTCVLALVLLSGAVCLPLRKSAHFQQVLKSRDPLYFRLSRG